MTMTTTNIVAGKFETAIKQYNMLDGCTGILVGYSGGADSSVLLRLLCSLCRERDISLVAVHVHHGIRGDEADRDAEFCRRTCEELGVEFKLIRADIPALARETGRGIEETARDFRYSEFGRILESDARLSHVAVAHNSDDNAETMIFNLVRGCGIDGLGGIAPIRPLGNIALPIGEAALCNDSAQTLHNGDSAQPLNNDDSAQSAYTADYAQSLNNDDYAQPLHNDDYALPLHNNDYALPLHNDDYAQSLHNDDYAQSLYNDDYAQSLHNDDCAQPPHTACAKRRAGILIRPLIRVQKREILGYCHENGIEYIIDSTNADTAYTRNYIRAEIIPRLERLNPSFLTAAERLAGLARADSDSLDRTASDYCASDTIALSELNSLDGAIASRVVIKLFAKHSPATLEACHVDSLLRLAATAREGASLSLPGKIRAEISRGKLTFINSASANSAYANLAYANNAAPQHPIEFEYPLAAGINQFTSPDFAAILLPKSKKCGEFEKYNERLKNIYKLSIHAELNSDKINHILFVRSRRAGDAYVFGGMTRRLKKLYNDHKLSPAERERLPVFCDSEGIVWVPGFAVADRVRADSDESLSLWYYYNPAN